MEFVPVSGGCYQMGDTFGDGVADEKPVHDVCVSDFYIGKYEVTQGEWEKVMGSNPSHFKGSRNPVESVSWNDAQAFIEKLNARTGKKFRLPTEAEWEYAARSGGKGEKWSGSSAGPDAVGWYDKNSGITTHPVGQKQPNGLGLYDMTGNVWEWCADWYGESYYGSSPKNDPPGPASGTYRVLRGGSWFYIPVYVRTSARYWNYPGNRGSSYGFRVLSSPHD
jgi:formylglycine-generating enzyme required for sulfatase activity